MEAGEEAELPGGAGELIGRESLGAGSEETAGGTDELTGREPLVTGAKGVDVLGGAVSVTGQTVVETAIVDVTTEL